MSILKDICIICGEDTFGLTECKCGEIKFVFSYDEFELIDGVLICKCGNKEFSIFEEILTLSEDRHIIEGKCTLCKQSVYADIPKDFVFFRV